MKKRFYERLASGSEVQQRVHAVLRRARVLEVLAAAGPEVVSSHCVGLDLPGSDIDVACQLESLDQGQVWLRSLFSDRPAFRLQRSQDSVVVAFESEGFVIEVFGQCLPVEQQRSFRHLELHERLLACGGEELRRQVLERKRRGMATEPAMAEAIGLQSDQPFEDLLALEGLSDKELWARVQSVMGDRKSSGENGEIVFYLDYISHNVYVAWHALIDLAGKHKRTIAPVPVLFAGLLDAHGSVGPAEVPAKARWMMRDVMRKAIDLDLPLAPPHSHPFLPLLPLRVTGVLVDPGDKARVVTELLAATWARSLDVSNPEIVAAVLDDIGLEGDQIVARAGDREAKDRLRRDTQEAIDRGVFGVPTMRVDDRLFWGYDDLINLDRYLSGEDPLESVSLPSWSEVKATAQRRRRDR